MVVKRKPRRKRRRSLRERMRECERRHRILAARLSRIGFLWYGSLRESRLTCGTASCACRKDPRARHGPYIYWTAKKRGRTVAKLLTQKEAEIYRQWIRNRREMDRLVRQMMSLSRKALNVAVALRSFSPA